MTGRVTHIRDHAPEAIYIGRAVPRTGLKASPFANPYRIGRDGAREEVIAKYRVLLLRSPGLLAMLHELRNKTLSCWCSPSPCHGDVIIETLERYTDRELHAMTIDRKETPR